MPLSPRTSTLTPRGATRSTTSSTRRIGGARATIRLPADLLGEAPLERLVLLFQPLALGLQALHLAGGVEGGAGERGHRVEEAAVVGGEGAVGVAADLLVEHGDVAEEDAAVGERRGEELLVGAAGQLAAGADERVPLGQQLAPDRRREQRVPGGQLVDPADRWRPRAARRRRRG